MNLSIDEYIKYIENGTIDSVPAYVVLELTTRIKELEEEIKEAEGRIWELEDESGYESGYEDAISEAIDALKGLR